MKYLAFAIALWGSLASAKWLDGSHEVFLTPELQSMAADFRDYPMFWWNFVVVDGALDTGAREKLCTAVLEVGGADIAKLPCAMELSSLKPQLEPWLADIALRRDYPTDFETQARRTLSRASLPLPAGALPLLRLDPLGELPKLAAQLEERAQFTRPLENGMIADATRVMIPVQLAFSPADPERARALVEKLKSICDGIPDCLRPALFGPHAGAVENELRIREDIHAISGVGVLAMLALAGFIIFTRRARIARLLPILGVGVALAVGLTILVFGSIHGIVLGFGPGIIGLALDYGVHAVFLDPRSRHTWRSNLAGLLTTLAILVILVFSAVPLLRQLMFFSIAGLTISFALFYFFLKTWPGFFATRPYALSPKSWRPGEWLAIALLVSAPLAFLRPVDLGVQHMNFESPRTQEIRRWFAELTGNRNPYWLEEESHESAWKTREWSLANGLGYEGLAAFLPPPHVQAQHLETWRKPRCASDGLTNDQRTFFAPHLQATACDRLKPRDITSNPPPYAADFQSHGRWVSLVFPQTDAQAARLKAQFPAAHTPREVFDAFPRVFLKELAWMVPLALIAAFLFLVRHFGNARSAAMALVPFLAGVGCDAIVSLALGRPLSFITLIGLLMVFGFSLDYGIFVVDLIKTREEGRHGVWSALSVCSFAALAGFAPLVFAGHPVMRDLGHTLLWGSLGTFVGTFWGIPYLSRRIAA